MSGLRRFFISDFNGMYFNSLTDIILKLEWFSTFNEFPVLTNNNNNKRNSECNY